MKLPTDILEILRKYLKEYSYTTSKYSYGARGGYEERTETLGKAIPEDKLATIANEIYTQVADTYIEDAELKAKVKTYEAIIENSNFKMALKGSTK